MDISFTDSRELSVKTGVQGSVLKPALVLIFVNNITKCILNSHLNLLVDDTFFVVSKKS